MNLSDFYSQNYLNEQVSNEENVLEEKTNVVKDKKPVKKEKEDEWDGVGNNKDKKKNFMKNKKQTKNESFDSLYQSILEEADEYDFGGEGDEFGGEDEGFDDVGSEDDFGGDDTITVSRSALEDLKAQIDALMSGLEGDEDYEGGFDYDEEDELGEDIPKESRWDGTLSPQGKSNLVKDNGDVNFDQELDFDPTEDNDGEVHTGPKGNFDGKLSKQKGTDLVGKGGNANFGKQKTGFKKTDKTGNKLFGK